MNRALQEGLQALRWYSTPLTEGSLNQRMSRNQCLLRYGQVCLLREKKDSRTSMRKMSDAESIGVVFVWKNHIQ
jgi:hypothetical protein